MYRAANRYEKIVFVTKVGREYENTKVHPKRTNLAQVSKEKGNINTNNACTVYEHHAL